jgi:hypothetical protein
LESKASKEFCLKSVMEGFEVKRRLAYDFVMCVCALGICKKTGENRFVWRGIAQIDRAIEEMLKELRDELGQHMTMKQIFCSDLGESFDKAPWMLLKLFLYLRVPKLDLRPVALFFLQGTSNYKTMLRRLYSIASTLEGLGFLRRTGCPAEVELSRTDWIDSFECRTLVVPDQRQRDFDAIYST